MAGCNVVLDIASDVLFEARSFALAENAETAIREKIPQLDTWIVLHVDVIGHTDSRGTEQYNQTLSEQRAAAVSELLVQKFHIDGALLNPTGRGETEPAVADRDSQGRFIDLAGAQNRRVALNFTIQCPETP